MRPLLFLFSLILLSSSTNCTGKCRDTDPKSKMNKVMPLKIKQWQTCHENGGCPKEKVQDQGSVPCVDGFAGEYPCNNVDLLSFVSLKSLGSVDGDGNDIWGWVDPKTQREYALFGAYSGTSVIDVTEPTNPSVIGWIPTATKSSFWRDIKVYQDHAYIVSEATGHGMQVFDLTLLRDLPLRPLFSNVTETEIATLPIAYHYTEFGNCHNIVINEETGFAYGVGTQTCNSGLHMIDIRDPKNPTFAGCYSEDGYVHDAQCVVYRGPDARFTGKEICFNYDEDTLTIVDVTVKSDPVTLSRVDYPNNQYTHQGWLLEGQALLLLDDELDEWYGPDRRTRTLIWDVSLLDEPKNVGVYYSSQKSIDHNLYVLGNKAYQANYCAGLRILDLTNAASGQLKEYGYFDVAPDCTTTEFLGSWSNYPYFPSGNIVVSSIDRGLFVLKMK